APASNNCLISSKLRTPPPTVSGIKHCSATRETISYKIPRSSLVAVISSKQSSSAPCASYIFACSTGSPASIRSIKLTPLTTRPSLISRQGIILVFSIFLELPPPLSLRHRVRDRLSHLQRRKFPPLY